MGDRFIMQFDSSLYEQFTCNSGLDFISSVCRSASIDVTDQHTHTHTDSRDQAHYGMDESIGL